MSTTNENTLKIKLIADHLEYQKGQVYDLKEKTAIALLTNGKAIRIHREIIDQIGDRTTEETNEKISEKTDEKPKLKTKKD